MKQLILLAFFFLLATGVFAQEGEPMANPECTTEAVAEVATQIDQYYAEAQTALSSGDLRGWLDGLRAVEWLTNITRAFCDGFHFEGDADGSNSEVFGPIVIQPGIYTVTATTDGYMSLSLEPIAGGCGRLSIIVSAGNASAGTQEVFRVEDENCTALLEISNLTEPWTLDFTFIATGE